MPNFTRAAVAAVLVLVLATSSALAILPHQPAAEALLQAAPLPPQRPLAGPDNAARSAADPGFQAFLAAAGGTWQVRWDGLTGRPSLLSGSGSPWLPGRGNSLTWNGLTADGKPANREVALVLMESRAQEFLVRHADFLRIPAGVRLAADPASPVGLDGGRLRVLNFKVLKAGVPVRGAHVSFRVNSGNLVQVSLMGVGDALAAAVTAPALPQAKALADAVGRLEGALARSLSLEEVLDSGTLQLLPWLASHQAAGTSEGLAYRLVWRVAFRVDDAFETWVSFVDAISGESLALHDDNRYACTVPPDPQGRVTGGVYVGAIEEVPETLRGMPLVEVNSGGSIVADYNGTFPFSLGQSATTSLSGRFFDMTCSGCSNPPQAFGQSDGPGNLSLGFGGVDNLGNGASTRAERNCFYHLNVVRQLAAKHVDDADVGGFLSRRTPATVNIAQTCNAFWNGNGVNFFRSGNGCNNTGEIADVMQHEWGHGLDQFTGGGMDGARGEGMADVVAFLSTQDPRLGPYFQVGDSQGIRSADENGPRGLLSVANVTTKCPVAGQLGPLGTEVHCEGEIYSQANWHLANNLRAKYGEVAGWYAMERLFFTHLPVVPDATLVPNRANSAYDALIFADDDNGDINDGTPNATEINDAYGHHGIASTPNYLDSAECLPPSAPMPVLTEVRANALTTLWQVRVSWPAVAGVTQYEVYRNDAGGVGADVPVAIILPPVVEYLDDNVTDGVTYQYRVVSFDAGGCVSQADNQVAAVVGPIVSFSVSSTTIDDAAANGNGFADPGEALGVAVNVQNTSGADATNVTATITTTHPAVTITRGTAAFGDLAAGVTATSGAPHFGLTLDAALASCGETIRFAVEMESTEGCSFGTFALRVGAYQGLFAIVSDDFEVDSGWIDDPAGLDDASAGRFVRADPNPTFNNRQLGDDHTPDPGVACWVTGNLVLDPRAQSSGGADDIDGGCTTLQSAVYDLGMRNGLQVSYWRHWSMGGMVRDDEFVAEISNDGGSIWLPLETITQSAPNFQQVILPLDQLFSNAPADRVVLRFTLCDQGGDSQIECLIDDFAIYEPQWLCESAEPRPRLSHVSTTIGDTPALGGTGDGDGVADPGERVRLPIDLFNSGNAAATNVVGSVMLLSGPAGTVVSDAMAAWQDVAIGTIELSGFDAPPHFEVTVPRLATCGDRIELLASVDYDGPTGSYQVDVPISLLVGAEVDTVVFADDMEGADDNGWVHAQIATNDDWARGAPQRTTPLDPAFANSGLNVWGNDLGGGMANGTYASDAWNYLESPSIDCSALSGTRLAYWRWLSVENGTYDIATIEVNAITVWQNSLISNQVDTEWTYHDLDISAVADGNPDVRIRFTLFADGGGNYGGWNIDDVSVFMREIPCDSACVGVPPAPRSAGPVLRATGVKDEDGAEFAWSADVLAQDEFYRLYRGTSPLALTDQVTPDGLLADRFDDRTAPDALYFYSLRVTTCAGLEGGD